MVKANHALSNSAQANLELSDTPRAHVTDWDEDMNVSLKKFQISELQEKDLARERSSHLLGNATSMSERKISGLNGVKSHSFKKSLSPLV